MRIKMKLKIILKEPISLLKNKNQRASHPRYQFTGIKYSLMLISKESEHYKEKKRKMKRF